MTTEQIIKEVEEIQRHLVMTNRTATQSENWRLAVEIQRSKLIVDQNKLLAALYEYLKAK